MKMLGVFEKSLLSLGDAAGSVYFSDSRVFRAISNRAELDIRELLGSGLIDELVTKGLFPGTHVSNVTIGDSALVLEHERIAPVTYPFEWSPEMLRRAALCVLEVNSIANKYGYELKDAHPYNIVFKGSKAIFVDLGSITKRHSDYGWLAYLQFLAYFYYPLRVRARGRIETFKRLFLLKISIGEIASLSGGFLQILGRTGCTIFFKAISSYKNGMAIGEDKIDTRFKNKVVRGLAKILLKSPVLPFRSVSMEQLKRRIRSIKISPMTPWARYHETSGYCPVDGAIALSPRLEQVRLIVANLKPQSILEIGGNQGALSRELARLDTSEVVICTDYDMDAIDSLFLRLGPNEKICAACFDFIGEEWQLLANERPDRLRTEMVVALAITHHLVLAQQYDIDAVFDSLLSFSRKYLIVEFMPLGLWDGVTGPAVPEWYSESWFEQSLMSRCKILEKVTLEANRVLYVAMHAA
jgi:hypothetical protein